MKGCKIDNMTKYIKMVNSKDKDIANSNQHTAVNFSMANKRIVRKTN